MVFGANLRAKQFQQTAPDSQRSRFSENHEQNQNIMIGAATSAGNFNSTADRSSQWRSNRCNVSLPTSSTRSKKGLTVSM